MDAKPGLNRGIAVLVFVFALLALQVCPARAAPVRFHIPAGPAAKTLRTFSLQSNINVLFQSDEVSTQETQEVSGTFEPVEALRLMLNRSGLQYQYREHYGVLISAEEKSTPPYTDRCGGPQLEPCGTAESERREFGSTVTVTATAVPTALDPGRMAIVDPYVTLTRPDFTAGGFQTVGDVLRGLPQNFGGGLNVGVILASGTQNITSQSAASTVNLRGLGSDSTLVLVNGQRLAATESSGASDVSLIPLAAVERIEITTGSASAQYGSDAVAGVINIVIRTGFQGVELGSALGSAWEGGGFLQHDSVVVGHAIGEASVFTTVDCSWQREIDSQERDYIPVALAGTTLMPEMQNCSTLFSMTGSLPGGLEAGVLGAYTKRFAYQALTLEPLPTNAIGSTRSDVAEYAINPILKLHLLHGWTTTLSGGLSADDVSSPEQLVQSGAPELYEGDRFDNRLWSGQLVASGPLAETHAGAVRLAVGAGYNQQDFLFAALPGGEFTIEKRRRIRFAFAETGIPLIASSRGANDPAALSLDTAIRTERYSDVGAATNSKISLTYQPLSSVKFQASWGTSFRAPSLLEEYDTPQAVLEVVPDGTGQSLALLRFGGNPLLDPETSTDTGLDLTWTPEALPGASFQVDYYAIFYRNRIDYPTTNTTDPLSDPNIAPFITRDPSAAAITQVLAQSQFIDLTEGQFLAREATLIIDDRNQNIARQRASGVDLLWKYGCDTAFGRWDASLNTAYLDLRQQATNATSMVPLSGTVFNPPVWRGRFGVSWSYRRYLGSLFSNYTGQSRLVSSPGQQAASATEPIASWTTLDGQIGILFNGDAHRGNTKLTLSAQNLLDHHPPLFSLSQPGSPSINYDSTNASPVGRFLTLQLTWAW